MDTDKFIIGQIEKNIALNDFNEANQTNEVKHEPCEIDNFEECSRRSMSDTSDTGLVDHKNAIDTDDYQEQKDESLDEKKLNPEDLCSGELSTSKCNTAQFKSEDDIDIVYENIKCETVDEKPSKLLRFCEVCSQSFERETDFYNKSASHSFECSCQKQNEPQFYNLHGEDITYDVKQTDSGLHQLEDQDEAISRNKVVKEQGTSAVPSRLSRPIIENDTEKQRKFCSKPLKNNLSEEPYMKTVKKEFRCKICLKSFHKNYLKVHERTHAGEKPFHCKICSKSFSVKGNLTVHERGHTGERPFHCTICSKSFSQCGHWKVHEKGHTGEKPFNCKICAKSFSRMSNMKVHERCHTGEKPFNCQICTKDFTTSRILKVHGMIHTGEKPFHCKTCSKSFNQSITLKIHESTHNGIKPFHCKICPKAFTSSRNLTIHERIHTGENLFHCKICPKAFTSSRNLTIHERIHTGEILFHCKICIKSFSQMGHLKLHERTHTGEKPFHCKSCSKSFSDMSNLKVHERGHR